MTKEERRAPVQSDDGYQLPLSHYGRPRGAMPPGTISWTEHLVVYELYSKRHGHGQDADKIAERGGFGYAEIVSFLGCKPITWKPR